MIDLDSVERCWERTQTFPRGDFHHDQAATVLARAVPALVAELRAARLYRDQLSRDASDARRHLGIAKATVVRLDTELRAAREVVEAVGVPAFLVALADFVVSTDGGYGRFGQEIPESLRELAFAKAAYDEVVGR